MDEEKNKKRDISIDLIRVIACLSVIGTHLALQVYNVFDVQVDWSRLFEKCFLTDGVPLFFMITGFFIANGRSYKKIWKSTLKKIILPFFLYIIFAQVFYLFIINKESFLYCIKNFNIDFLGIFYSIVTGSVSYLNSLCDHLWYIYSYIKIIIWIPVLWLICKEEKIPQLARRMILFFGIISTFIIDVQKFIVLPIGPITPFNMVGREIIYVLLGYELFVFKDKIKGNKKVFVVATLGFVLTNILRYKLEMQYMIINHFYDIVGRESFMEWKYTCLNIISGLCIFMLIYSFELKSEKMNKIILWLSDKTFGIYLLHYLILAKIDLYKFEKIGKVMFELIYLVVGLLVTLILSILIIILIRKIKEFIMISTKKILKVTK